MKKSIAIGFLLTVFLNFTYGQELTQTVRGTVLDVDSRLPLIGGTIIVIDSDPFIGAATDVNGRFKLVNVPVGRITLKISSIGYQEIIIPNIVVNSGKEVVLNLDMQESLEMMDEFVVKAYQNKGEAINDMTLISARSISPEETNRYAGGFNDPSRITANFAGVTNTQDGSNDIIVRGNSPKYIQWRLEGVEISNPNHFADQNGVSASGISALNNNLLATSDFHTGAFSPEYGDVLSGIYDIKLRAGNNEQFEGSFGLGILGTDLTLEGPFKKGYGGSYLVNYRYSTVSLIRDLGLVDVDGIPKFQDAAFKIQLPTKKIGIFSFFGLAGLSGSSLDSVGIDDGWTAGDNPRPYNVVEQDYKTQTYLVNTGMNHSLILNDRSYLKTTLAYSVDGIQDDVFESHLITINDINGLPLRDSITDKALNYQSRLKKSAYRGSINYHNKLNAKNKIQIGTKYNLFVYDNKQSMLQNNLTSRVNLLDFEENINTVRNFIAWKHRFNEAITMVAGVHNMNVLFNNKSTLEPRVAFNWKLSKKSAFSAGYGNHSTMESIHNYFAKVVQEDGSITEANRDLDLLKAHHYILGYERRFSKNLLAKVEVYFQDLYNLPVENNDTSYYATINEGLDYKYVDLVNKGTGENYGIEVTLERFFANNYYFLLNASLYNSTYKSLDGVTRNTQYNGNYLVNFLCGKEFENLGKKKNQTLGLNAKMFFGGGKKYIPLLRGDDGKLAVDPKSNSYWDYDEAYENKIEDIYQLTISTSYKWNKPKTTYELWFNLDNITNSQGKLSEYYDESEPNSIGYTTQFGFFPNMMFRVYF
ncbi:MAG: TonB-dependent receptor [Flavobacteriales bacterium]|nr:TonB-dependent receptor [Flavobacteriales bacterium]